MQLWEEFATLFTGSDSAYGEWIQGREPHPALTKHAKPTEVQYRAHLDGTIGLGIVPVNSEGLCRFGAIDIDVDTIDHAVLYKAVSERQLPLSVCRSKSGGAHLYIFTTPAGLPASQVQQLLGRWATALGYPTAEIFPKQRKVGSDNAGNWINLPYFGGDKTTRYAVGVDGAMTLAEFLKSVVVYDPEKVISDVKVVASFPPCLAKLKEKGVGAGQRNSALFNYAVFYRKSDPSNWETLTRAQNSQYFSPPLDYREVTGILQSAGRTSYQYMCDQEPCKSYCDRTVCETLPFGVGHMPWDEANAYDVLQVENCRKLVTSPPKYILNVNREDIILSWDEFFTYSMFRSKVGQELDLVIEPRKQQSWEQEIRKLLNSKTVIEAPEDASTMGLIIDKLHEFLVLRERATEKEDLLRGLPVQDGEHVLFRMADFKRYLQGAKLDKVEGADLFLVLLKKHEITHKSVVLNGRQLSVWSYPVSKINEQTEGFKVPDFKKDFEEV